MTVGTPPPPSVAPPPRTSTPPPPPLPASMLNTDSVTMIPNVVVQLMHHSQRSLEWFTGKGPSTDIAVLKEFVLSRLKSPITMPDATSVDYYLVKPIRKHDMKGPFSVDLLFGLLTIVVRVPGDKAFPKRWCLQEGDPDKIVQVVHIESPGGGAVSNTTKMDLETWLQRIFKQGDRPLGNVASALKEAGITSLEQLLAMKEDRIPRIPRLSVGDVDFILEQRQLFVNLPTKLDEATKLQLKAFERANLHKVRRLIYYEAGKIDALPLLDPDCVRAGVYLIEKEYKNEPVIKQLKNEFLRNFTSFQKMPRGLLLFGPPGTGKTMLVKLLCKYCGIMMVEPNMVAAGELNKGHVGESEELIATLFRRATLIPHLPCIVAIDEIDSAVPKRKESGGGNSHGDDKVSMFLSLIDGGGDVPNLILVGASNRREAIDDAVRRRLEKQIYVGFLDNASRKALITKRLLLDTEKMPQPLREFQKEVQANVSVIRDIVGKEGGVGSSDKGADACVGKIHPIFPLFDKGMLGRIVTDVINGVNRAVDLVPTPKEFYEFVLDDVTDLTFNFSGSAIDKVCEELLIEWVAFFRDGVVLCNGEKFLRPSTIERRDRLKSGQYVALLGIVSRVATALDLKVGPFVLSNLLSSKRQIVPPTRRAAWIQSALNYSGLGIINLAPSGSAPCCHDMVMQMEKCDAEGTFTIDEFDMRPHCTVCNKYGAVQCTSTGKLHGWCARGALPVNEHQMDQVAVTTEDVIKEVVYLAKARGLTRVIYRDMSNMILNGQSNESEYIQDLAACIKQSQALGSATAVIIDLDSIAGVQRNDSEGSMGSTSYSIGNRQLFDFVVESFLSFRTTADPTKGECRNAVKCSSQGEGWCFLLIRNQYLCNVFREKTSWPLTAAEVKQSNDLEERSKPMECKRCKLVYSRDADDAVESVKCDCQYHNGVIVKIPAAKGGVWLQMPDVSKARLEVIEIQRASLDTLPGGAVNPRSKDQVVYSCCFQPLGSGGCCRGPHTQELFQPSIPPEYKSYF